MWFARFNKEGICCLLGGRTALIGKTLMAGLVLVSVFTCKSAAVSVLDARVRDFGAMSEAPKLMKQA